MRQVALGENLTAVQGGEGRLGRREHEVHAVIRRILDLIDLVGELRELSRGFAALILEHQGKADHLVAVLQVLVDEVVEQGPLEARAHAAVDPEAGARQTRAALIVDEAEVRAQVHMVLRLEVEVMRLAVVAQRLIVLLAARLEVGVRQVRQGQHQRAVLRLDVRQLLVVLGDLGLQLGHAREDRRDVLARLLALRDLLGDAVLLGLIRLR